MEVARTSMIHAAAPHFLCSFAVRYAAHQLNLWPRVSEPETSPTLRWTGKVGDASVFGFGARSPLFAMPKRASSPLALSSASSLASLRTVLLPQVCLRPPPFFPPRPSSPPPQRAAVDSGAETIGAEPGGAETEGEGSEGAATGGAGSGGAVTGGADSGATAA
ncbi:unnamed protein product [Closterium sp. NIES-54]